MTPEEKAVVEEVERLFREDSRVGGSKLDRLWALCQSLLKSRARWKVIEVGKPWVIGSGYCVFDGQGPPNSNHPQTTDRSLAERICRLLNESEP